MDRGGGGGGGGGGVTLHIHIHISHLAKYQIRRRARETGLYFFTYFISLASLFFVWELKASSSSSKKKFLLLLEGVTVESIPPFPLLSSSYQKPFIHMPSFPFSREIRVKGIQIFCEPGNIGGPLLIGSHFSLKKIGPTFFE